MKMKIMDKIAESLGLSLREIEVLKHLAEGKTNVEISCLLRISERTVEKHLERVYKKLGVGCRTSAALFFIYNKDLKELQKPHHRVH